MVVRTLGPNVLQHHKKCTRHSGFGSNVSVSMSCLPYTSPGYTKIPISFPDPPPNVARVLAGFHELLLFLFILLLGLGSCLADHPDIVRAHCVSLFLPAMTACVIQTITNWCMRAMSLAIYW